MSYGDPRAEPARAAVSVHLLGSPAIEWHEGEAYRFRSRKSWALFTYLLLSERAPTRSQLAGLLFASADDPLRALRWSLAEIRRGLGAEGSLDGDPVVLHLPPGARVDAKVVVDGLWSDAVQEVGLGCELLDGLEVRGAPVFGSWLLSERLRMAAASEAVLHEAALALMSQGSLARARNFALRAAALSPLDENHQALLIRLYRLGGNDDAAKQQYDAYVRMLDVELGVSPGEAVHKALQARIESDGDVADDTSIEAVMEAGTAAISAGALDHGTTSLRTAVRLADQTKTGSLRTRARLVLAEALIHARGGLDEEGLAVLHETDRIAFTMDDQVAMAQARSELGYVNFLRGRYNRARVWLEDALAHAVDSPTIMATATTYLGSVESDRGNYLEAIALLKEGVRLAGVAADPRRAAFALSMLGRVSLTLGDPDTAHTYLDEALGLAEHDHWLFFLPWPQSLKGEAHLALQNVDEAADALRQSFARACQFEDPCWEGMSTRGLALVAEAQGDTELASTTLDSARLRCNRRADPYTWLNVHILDAQCVLGRRHRHPQTRRWVEQMRDLASRSGMKELTVRAMLHAAALGDEGDAAAARLIAAELDNPVLAHDLSMLS